MLGRLAVAAGRSGLRLLLLAAAAQGIATVAGLARGGQAPDQVLGRRHDRRGVVPEVGARRRLGDRRGRTGPAADATAEVPHQAGELPGLVLERLDPCPDLARLLDPDGQVRRLLEHGVGLLGRRLRRQAQGATARAHASRQARSRSAAVRTCACAASSCAPELLDRPEQLVPAGGGPGQPGDDRLGAIAERAQRGVGEGVAFDRAANNIPVLRTIRSARVSRPRRRADRRAPRPALSDPIRPGDLRSCVGRGRETRAQPDGRDGDLRHGPRTQNRDVVHGLILVGRRCAGVRPGLAQRRQGQADRRAMRGGPCPQGREVVAAGADLGGRLHDRLPRLEPACASRGARGGRAPPAPTPRAQRARASSARASAWRPCSSRWARRRPDRSRSARAPAWAATRSASRRSRSAQASARSTARSYAGASPAGAGSPASVPPSARAARTSSAPGGSPGSRLRRTSRQVRSRRARASARSSSVGSTPADCRRAASFDSASAASSTAAARARAAGRARPRRRRARPRTGRPSPAPAPAGPTPRPPPAGPTTSAARPAPAPPRAPPLRAGRGPIRAGHPGRPGPGPGAGRLPAAPDRPRPRADRAATARTPAARPAPRPGRPPGPARRSAARARRPDARSTPSAPGWA